jgi:hypothetical protein
VGVEPVSERESVCDHNNHHGQERPRAEWVYIGESGDLYLCGEHYSPAPGWRQMPPLEPGVGVEPTTPSLRVTCSTTELTGQDEGA